MAAAPRADQAAAGAEPIDPVTPAPVVQALAGFAQDGVTVATLARFAADAGVTEQAFAPVIAAAGLSQDLATQCEAALGVAGNLLTHAAIVDEYMGPLEPYEQVLPGDPAAGTDAALDDGSLDRNVEQVRQISDAAEDTAPQPLAAAPLTQNVGNVRLIARER